MRGRGISRESTRFARGEWLDVLTVRVGEMGLFRTRMRRLGVFEKG